MQIHTVIKQFSLSQLYLFFKLQNNQIQATQADVNNSKNTNSAFHSYLESQITLNKLYEIP